MKTCVAPLLVGLLLLGACKDKEPYPGARPWSPGPKIDVAAPGVPVDVLGPGPGRPVDAQVASPQPVADETPRGAVAVVVTPEGSFVVTGGAELDVRHTDKLVRVTPAGDVHTLQVQAWPAEKAPKKGSKESTFATLTYGAGGKARDLLAARAPTRPDLAGAKKADKDLAADMYHREKLALVGVHGAVASYVIHTEGFLGGAHPYATRELLVVDADTGEPADAMHDFKGRDLGREVLGTGTPPCVGRFAGVAPMDGRGGDVTWVAALSHSIEACAGEMRLARVEPPSGAPPSKADDPLVGGAIRLGGADGPQVTGVLDARVSKGGDVAVLLMALGRDDRLQAPPERLKPDGKTREIRVWTKGMKAPVVAGRASTLLGVQFLTDRAGSKKVLEGLAGVY